MQNLEGGGADGQEAHAKGAASAKQPKPAKKDYAAWAAATPEFRAVASAARHSSAGGGHPGTPPAGTPGTTPPGVSYMAGLGGDMRMGTSPGRVSPIRFASGGGGGAAAAAAAAAAHDAAAAHVPRMPDGSRGFSMGRGKAMPPPPLA